MDRIFHARIAWYQYAVLAVVTFNAVGALWIKAMVPSLFLMFFMIVLVEWMVHTKYVITGNGTLVVYNGRFVRRKEIPLDTIVSVQRCRSMRIGRFSVTDYLLIRYGQGQHVSVLPVRREEFLHTLDQRIRSIRQTPSDGDECAE